MKEFIDNTGAVGSGTPINRANLMAIQGFQNNSISIYENGDVTTITEVNGDNETNTTIITEYADGHTVITETFTGEKTLYKTTTINALGTVISEVISNELG